MAKQSFRTILATQVHLHSDATAIKCSAVRPNALFRIAKPIDDRRNQHLVIDHTKEKT